MLKKKILFLLLFSPFSTFCQNWHSLWSGVGSDVNSLIVHNNLLYVGGCFEWANGLDSIGWPDGILATGVATWDGTEWDSIRNIYGVNGMPGFGPCVKSIEFYNNEIYIGGNFVDISVSPSRLRLAKIDSTNNWCDVGNIGYPNAEVKIISIKNILYFAGGFNYIGSAPNYNSIAGWDGSNFSKLGDGLQGGSDGVYDLVEYNGMLIAGGGFGYAGDTTAFSIAAWNGQKWYPLDTGLWGSVYAMTLDTINNFLYAAGGCSYAGGNYDMIPLLGIAKWDGYEWSSVGWDTLYGTRALVMYHNILYAGGATVTTLNNGDTVKNISKWNGEKWSPVLVGTDNAVLALEVYNDELYVGGGFHKAGDSICNFIARYYEPPDTCCDYLQAIIQPKNAVLKISDSTTVHFYNNIIHGGSWYWDFGDGGTDTVRMPVHTYADTGVYNVSVIVTYLNCTDTAYTTITIVDDTGIKDNKEDTVEYLGQNIPNPFDNSTAIPYYVPYGSKGFLQITDAKGELVDEYALQQGKNKLTISLEYLKAGTYFYSIVIDGKVMQTKKMVLE